MRSWWVSLENLADCRRLQSLALPRSTLGDGVWAHLAASAYGAVKALPIHGTWNIKWMYRRMADSPPRCSQKARRRRLRQSGRRRRTPRTSRRSSVDRGSLPGSVVGWSCPTWSIGWRARKRTRSATLQQHSIDRTIIISRRHRLAASATSRILYGKFLPRGVK